MKTKKATLLLAILLMFLGVSYAQNSDNFQAYHVHEDQVKPPMLMQYENTAKALVEKMNAHNIKSTSWIAVNTDDNRYLYVTPIKNMADLDKRSLAPLREKMGGEAFTKLMSGFGPCYDKHGDYVVYLDKEISYMPTGFTLTPEGEDFRKLYYLHFAPRNASDMRKAMMAVKNMFETKKSALHYRVFRSGFGTMGSFYMVAVAAKDPIEMEQKGAANEKLLGEDAAAIFGKINSFSLKFEEYTAKMRPKLAYMPKE